MKKITSTILNVITLGGLLALCASFLAIRLLGFGTYIVTGGSMEPTIHKGSLVLIQPVEAHDVKVGDVITFQQYGQTTTHRVIAIGQSSTGLAFKTKGDANTVADPEDKTFPGEVGVARLAIPALGYAAFAVQAYWRLALTLIAAITFFSCAGGLVLRKEKVITAVPARRLIRPVLVTVDADETWAAHVEWLRRSHRNTMVA